MPPSRTTAKEGPTAIQRSHPALTPHNETYDTPTQRPYLCADSRMRQSIPHGATFDATLGKNTRLTHRNRRLPHNKVYKVMSALLEHETSRPQGNQAHQAPNRDPHLAKAAPIAIHATSHMNLTGKQTSSVQKRTPTPSFHPCSSLGQRMIDTTSEGTGLHFEENRISTTVIIAHGGCRCDLQLHRRSPGARDRNHLQERSVPNEGPPSRRDRIIDQQRVHMSGPIQTSTLSSCLGKQNRSC